jgi:hypothetical protein
MFDNFEYYRQANGGFGSQFEKIVDKFKKGDISFMHDHFYILEFDPLRRVLV